MTPFLPIAEITISDVTTIITAIVGGVVAIIGSLVAAFVAIRTSQTSNSKKLDQIHQLTNSNLTRVTEELAALRLLVEKNAESGIVTKPTIIP